MHYVCFECTCVFLTFVSASSQVQFECITAVLYLFSNYEVTQCWRFDPEQVATQNLLTTGGVMY